MKKYSKRIQNALEAIPSYSDIYKISDTGSFVEIVVNRWGDTCTFRVYNNGEVFER